jgi:hypothetical protein
VDDWKATVPVGAAGMSVPGAVVVTVVENVTVCPEAVAVGMAVAVAASVVVKVSGETEVDPLKFKSPE